MGRLMKAASVAALVVALGAVFAPSALATTPLEISKTATGHWTRSFEWTIDKSVTPATHALETGESGSSTYTVALMKSAGTDSIWVDGQVCVTNGDGETAATENLVVEDRVIAIHDGGSARWSSGRRSTCVEPGARSGREGVYPYSFPIARVSRRDRLPERGAGDDHA